MTTDTDYITTYMQFLTLIGTTGRRSLRYLRLTVTGDPNLHRPNADKAIEFWEVIGNCTNLSTLDVYADIDYFYMEQRAALKLYLSTEGFPISQPWSEVLLTLQRLPHLTRLVVRPIFSSQWQYFDVEQIVWRGQEQRADVMGMRFVVHRPVIEAARGVEQLKAYPSEGLWGSASVHVMMTEPWGVGADVTFRRGGFRGEDWTFGW